MHEVLNLFYTKTKKWNNTSYSILITNLEEEKNKI